jgi:hypothetical protein
LANVEKIFSSETKLSQIKPNLTGSIYVRSSIKLLHLVPFGQQTWPPRAIPFLDHLGGPSIDASYQVSVHLVKRF